MNDFVFLFRIGAEAQREAMGTPEHAEQSMRVWLEWIRQLEEKGYLKSPGQPLEQGGRVIHGRDRTVTDGPFVEVKDLIAGFMIVQAEDLDDAATAARGCPILEGGGSVEVRPVRRF
jgi:hypothetical protein